MSEENVEIVRAAFDAWNRGDSDAWISAWDEQGVFHPLRAELEGGAYRGHDGLRRFIEEMAAEWEEVRFEVDEIRDTGERMVASGRIRARGRASGMDLDVPLGVVGILQQGKIVYARFYSDPAEALAASRTPE